MQDLRSAVDHDCHEQGAHYQGDSMVHHHAEAYDLTGEDIQDRSQVNGLAFPAKMSEVRCQDMVLIAWQMSHKQIGEYTAVYLGFSILSPSSPVWLDAVRAHHPKDALLVKVQMSCQSFVSVARVVMQGGFDQYLGLPVFGCLPRSVVQA